MTAPSWAPSLAEVADYITSRTVNTVTPGSDTPAGVFSSTTYPTDTQVTRLIDGACSWVTVVTGTIAVGLESSAKAVAAMRTAGLVELSYPLRNDEVDEVARVLLEQATAGRDELVSANHVAGGVVISGVPSPSGSFPEVQWDIRDGPAWGYPR